jgi:hypothetical protein
MHLMNLSLRYLTSNLSKVGKILLKFSGCVPPAWAMSGLPPPPTIGAL